MAHIDEKHWYFPLRAIFILWTGTLRQHDISSELGHMVPQPSLPGVPVAKETDEVLYREDQGVWGQVLGAGHFSEVLSCPVYTGVTDTGL